MKQTLVGGYDIIPTKESVKEMIFRPIMLALYGKNSTTKLLKQKEIDAVYDVICKHFGQLGIAVPPFPSYLTLSLDAEAKNN